MASISSQDETDITATIPGCSAGFGFCVTDKWVALTVQRVDSGEWIAFRWWVKADLLALQLDTGLTEKIPTGEDLDDPTNECLTATLWNRLVTFVEFLAYEVLTAKGSILARDLVGPAELLVGPDGRNVRRTPAGSGHETGLLWGPPKRIWTYRFGRLIDTTNTNNGAMVANGAADAEFPAPSARPSTHGMARDGVFRHLVVNVESSSGGDTLDRVIVTWNLAITIHDSGTGLGIVADGAYLVDLDLFKAARDLEIEVFKIGSAGTMAISAYITVEEETRPRDLTGNEELLADAVAVTDSITAEIILGTTPMEDAVAATDGILIELTTAIEMADSIDTPDGIEIEMFFGRGALSGLNDTVDVTDQLTVEFTQGPPSGILYDIQMADLVGATDAIEAIITA